MLNTISYNTNMYYNSQLLKEKQVKNLNIQWNYYWKPD